MRSVLMLICCSLLVAGAMFARTDRGIITGAIADPAGALIPNAPIEAKNNETGALNQSATPATGSYTLRQLSDEVYQITVSVPGPRGLILYKAAGTEFDRPIALKFLSAGGAEES